ncbi:hypothetical protein [Pelomonas sp. SE-A7]|uniref:M61 family metallopeptidase n=1 Tax=Pelomonas sp. SE-A7 TaxID=3054953 RepID=UPI00259CAF41|nr:hypothetical protein [Pelomonas sp. SE-A7]MDM4765866.1 hypothetical protein [Pelomonas sp. SE-A7]
MSRPQILSAAACLLLLAGAARAEEAACDLHYRVTPRYDTQPRRLDVELSFAAEGRRESWLRLSNGWAGIKDFGASLSPAGDQAAGVKLLPGEDIHRWKVEHGPEGQVRVGYQVRAALADPDDGKTQNQDQLYRTQIGADWFQFFGYGVLPSVEAWDDKRAGRMCLSLVQRSNLTGPLLGSHFDGKVQAQAEASLQGTHALLRHAFYAGGPGWRVVERQLASGPVVTASRGPQSLGDAAFADQVARLLDAHRRFWGDASSPRQSVVRTPNNSRGNNGGTLVHQAAVLHVSSDFGPNNDSFDFLIGHENLHQWLPHRLGGHDGNTPEAAARHYWLSEGLTDYYTHRLLLAGGLWTLDRYAELLTRALRGHWRSPARNATAESIAPRFFSDRDAGRQMYSRGEILAMGWDRELRAKDPTGLDALLRGLMLPEQQARGAEPAHERVLKALTAALGPRPREQVQAHVVEGRSFELDEGLAGPCFALRWDEVPRWVPGFDMASLTSGAYKVQGVIVDGPAHKAGLRDGMELKGWSIFGNEVAKPIEIKVKTEAGDREIKYLPVDGSTDRLPTLTVRPGAATDAACQTWLRR